MIYNLLKGFYFNFTIVKIIEANTHTFTENGNKEA